MTSTTFTVCSDCGRHARIVTETGGHHEVFSKMYAVYMLGSGVAHGIIAPTDLAELQEQIAGSSLPTFDSEVVAEFKAFVSTFNIAMDAGDSDWSQRTLHDFLDHCQAQEN